VPERIVAGLADIFGWEVDVENGLRPGDEFRVLYENLWQAGLSQPGTGNVLGAEIVAGARVVTAVYFEDEDGRGAYYRPSGDPLEREFLRYPVEFNEITSEFSLLRRHPILHVGRPHLGVDFAAPRGTPVRAVAGGRVSFAARTPELGRSVRIEHPGGLTSVYGHLAAMPPGVKSGVAVERGQVIGYVGSSGLATGPHLHYALERDGEYVDPMAFASTVERPIGLDARRMFERVQTEITRQLAALPAGARPTTVSLSSTAYPSAAYRSE
jgi:murein DD-endopeptidase MepM/ murein hydrolase activator NlpD